MNTLNKEIRSLEMLLLSRKEEEGAMRRRIGYLRLSHKGYRQEQKDLNAWRFESRIIQCELEYKKRQLEILRAYMIAGVRI